MHTANNENILQWYKRKLARCFSYQCERDITLCISISLQYAYFSLQPLSTEHNQNTIYPTQTSEENVHFCLNPKHQYEETCTQLYHHYNLQSPYMETGQCIIAGSWCVSAFVCVCGGPMWMLGGIFLSPGVDKRQMSWHWASRKADNFNSFWSRERGEWVRTEDRGDDRRRRRCGDERVTRNEQRQREGSVAVVVVLLSLHITEV